MSDLEAEIPLDCLEPYGSGNGGPGDTSSPKGRQRSGSERRESKRVRERGKR